MDIKLSLDRIGSAQFLNDQILYGIKNGQRSFATYPKETVTYSNICAPVAGVINFYRKKGYEIFVNDSECDYIKHLQIGSPYVVKDSSTWELDKPLDKVWTLSEEGEVWKLVNAILLEIRESTELESGVAQGLEWCMNESIDNVLQHAHTDHCFVMAQLHKKNKRFGFCVFDTGIGIYNSFLGSPFEAQTPTQALKNAMSEGITSDKQIGQGNGLWGLSQIIKETKGMITLCSSGALYTYSDGNEKWIDSGCFNLGREKGTTMVDFQLDYSKPIDVARALNGYEPYDKWTEDHENDKGEFIVRIAEEASGTGTRLSAEKIRNIVVGAKNNNYSTIIIDFEGVLMIGSSFADELIGKLIAKYGFSKFMQHIVIMGTNDLTEAIINRSVGQRMAQVFMDQEIDETE